MPHIIIKTIKGPSQEQCKDAAKQIAQIVSKVMGKPMKYVSVSLEEYSFSEWKNVHDEYIKDNKNVVIAPGYSNPQTFE